MQSRLIVLLLFLLHLTRFNADETPHSMWQRDGTPQPSDNASNDVTGSALRPFLEFLISSAASGEIRVLTVIQVQSQIRLHKSRQAEISTPRDHV